MEQKQKFQVLDGGLRPIHRASKPKLGRQAKPSLDMYQLEPCAGELTTAYKAAERRLHLLLEDRVRIGRDLHDSVLQSLYAIGLNIEMARRASPDQTTEAKASDDRMIQQINQLIREVRDMIRELETGTVHDFNLSSELVALSSRYEQNGRLSIKLDLQPSALEVLTNEEEREILNIVRESISNGVRHGHATQVTVSIRLRDGRIRVSVTDDGIGFSVISGQPRGYGLTNMEARAKKLGGTLRVQSKPGQGTQVAAEFSLEPVLTPL